MGNTTQWRSTSFKVVQDSYEANVLISSSEMNLFMAIYLFGSRDEGEPDEIPSGCRKKAAGAFSILSGEISTPSLQYLGWNIRSNAEARSVVLHFQS